VLDEVLDWSRRLPVGRRSCRAPLLACHDGSFFEGTGCDRGRGWVLRLVLAVVGEPVAGQRGEPVGLLDVGQVPAVGNIDGRAASPRAGVPAKRRAYGGNRRDPALTIVREVVVGAV
jgi:hypothetical protein